MNPVKRMLCLALILALLTAAGIMPVCAAGGAMLARQSLAGLDAAACGNAARAAEAINGYYLPQGSYFSFNDATGARTEENGYAYAADDGGVDRVATALYRALSAGGARVEYAALSFSADGLVRVSEAEGLDFSFFNYDADYYIELYADGEAVNCSISCAAAEDSWNAGSALVGNASLWLNGPEALRSNAALACGSVNDTTLGPGDVFSFNDVVGPRTREYGYQAAPNGAGLETVGGGVDAVASVLYMAVRDLNCVAITEKNTYGGRYNQSYVSGPQDALLTDDAAGMDFCFRYTGSNALAIYISLIDGQLSCEIYETTSW